MEFSTFWLEDAIGETLVAKNCRGSLDHTVCESFKDSLFVEARGRPHRLVIDLSGVEFMDSTGLAALICLLKRLGSGAEIVLCGLSRDVSNFLWLTHMDRVFVVVSDLDTAVAGMSATRRKRVSV